MKVVVLSFDSLPVSYLGCYGNPWVRTPHLDELAVDSVVFDLHFGENFDADARQHAWWTGRYEFRRIDASPAEEPAALLSLRSAGVRTRLVIQRGSSVPVPAELFDSITWIEGTEDPQAEEETAIARLVEQGCAAIRESAENPQVPELIWLHARGVAEESLPPPPYDEFYEDLEELTSLFDEPDDEDDFAEELEDELAENVTADNADAASLSALSSDPEVAASESSEEGTAPRRSGALDPDDAGWVTLLDEQLGSLHTAVEELARETRVLFAVTAAMGSVAEADVDFANLETDFQPLAVLRQSRIQSPLLMRVSTAAPLPGRFGGLTQSVDLLPTLLEWFEVAIPASVEGKSMLPILQGERVVLRESAYLGAGEHFRGVRTPEFSLLLQDSATSRGPQATAVLFVKPDDRWDVDNVARQYPEVVENLTEELRRFSGRGDALTTEENAFLPPQ